MLPAELKRETSNRKFKTQNNYWFGPKCNCSACKYLGNQVATLLHHDFNQIKQIRNLGLDPLLQTVLCFYFYVFLFFCVSYIHLLLFVITFVFLYISRDVIIDFNFYQSINKQYIHTWPWSVLKENVLMPKNFFYKIYFLKKLFTWASQERNSSRTTPR